MTKFRNKYRIDSCRLKNWDYGWNGAYFITFVTDRRIHYFGDVVDAEMHLNALGELASQFWEEIPERFPYIYLGNFVVMPNHVHGVLIVDQLDDGGNEDEFHSDAKRSIASVRGGVTGDNNPMLHDNISRVIRWYKGRCTFEMRKIHAGFKWQGRFYDHVIRNSDSFDRIQGYIESNPLKWSKDRLNA